MTPAELKHANIERFEALLREEENPARRETLERLMALEIARPLSGYPVQRSGSDGPG